MLLAPVQALAAWFVPAQKQVQPVLRTRTRPARARPAGHCLFPRQPPRRRVKPPTPASQAPKRPTPSRLRIVREFDANVSPGCAGRMVISGRMADVCAELERMAQREAALQ